MGELRAEFQEKLTTYEKQTEVLYIEALRNQTMAKEETEGSLAAEDRTIAAMVAESNAYIKSTQGSANAGSVELHLNASAHNTDAHWQAVSSAYNQIVSTVG